MGFEYQLELSQPTPVADLARLLRSIPGFSGIEPTTSAYTYRVDGSDGRMPNAEARIEESGIYVCDYGGGAQFLSAIVMTCLSELGEVKVSRLDWD